MLKLRILGIPQSKQSARFRIAKKKTGANFIMSYQKKSVKDNEKNIAYDVKAQLPLDFIPFDEPIGVKVLFVFGPLKSWKKATKLAFENNELMYKQTKPDLTDNLMKGLFDAMNGIVFIDDSRISKVESQKVYGKVPRTEVEIYKLK